MKSILVVEDEEDILEAVVTILSEEGFTTVACRDGLEALDHLRGHPPDLVISDIMMPNCDGYRLLEHVRASTNDAHLPFILMSAAALHAGEPRPDAFLKKPFNLSVLLDLVEKMIGRPS